MSQTPQTPLVDNRAEAPTASSPPAASLTRCPEFRPAALGRQLWLDSLAWWTLPLLMIVVLMAMTQTEDQSLWLMGVGVGVACGAMIVMMNSRGNAVLRDLPRISVLIEEAPDEAEPALAAALGRRLLPRGLRLLLYHRLSCLRHRQGRYDESALIAQTLLQAGQKLMPAVRANLLLLFIESRLERGGLADAHAALMDMHRMTLPLLESLQRLWLQTRYEVMAGHDAHALTDLRRRIELAELMPATQCGLMHLLLAVAAERQGRDAQAQWLRQRAELLCTDEQRKSLDLRDGVVG